MGFCRRFYLDRRSGGVVTQHGGFALILRCSAQAKSRSSVKETLNYWFADGVHTDDQQKM